MRIEATPQEIGVLLRLAELDGQAQSLPPDVFSTRREQTRRQIQGALLERYDFLLGAGRHPAVVAIERGGCSGCHVRLATMVAHQARRAGAVHTCPRCRRMLYAPEVLGDEASRAAGSGKRAMPRGGVPAAPGTRS